MNEEKTGLLEDELKMAKAEAETLKGTLAERDAAFKPLQEELTQAKAGLRELEQTAAGRDSELAALKQVADESAENLKGAVAAYREAVIKVNPGAGELISGGTIEEINRSSEKAKAIIARVRESVEAEAAKGKVPAGSPERKPPDLSSLSAREKIHYAVSKGGNN